MQVDPWIHGKGLFGFVGQTAFRPWLRGNGIVYPRPRVVMWQVGEVVGSGAAGFPPFWPFFLPPVPEIKYSTKIVKIVRINHFNIILAL